MLTPAHYNSPIETHLELYDRWGLEQGEKQGEMPSEVETLSSLVTSKKEGKQSQETVPLSSLSLL